MWRRPKNCRRRRGDNAAGRKAKDNLVLGTHLVLSIVRSHGQGSQSYLMGGKGRSMPVVWHGFVSFAGWPTKQDVACISRHFYIRIREPASNLDGDKGANSGA